MNWALTVLKPLRSIKRGGEGKMKGAKKKKKKKEPQSDPFGQGEEGRWSGGGGMNQRKKKKKKKQKKEKERKKQERTKKKKNRQCKKGGEDEGGEMRGGRRGGGGEQSVCYITLQHYREESWKAEKKGGGKYSKPIFYCSSPNQGAEYDKGIMKRGKKKTKKLTPPNT